MLYWAVRYANGMITGYKTWDKDQIIFYNGLFNIPTYFVWYFAPDKGLGYVDIGDMLELMIFEAPQPKTYNDPDYTSDFIVENIIFDVQKKCFKIVCVNYFWKVLSTKKLLASIEVGTRDNPITGFEAIEKMLDIGWRDQERRAQISATAIIKNTSDVKYSVISVDPEISVLDVIGRICNDNGWEWYLGHGGMQGESPAARSRINTIYIGKKIKVDERWALPFNIEEEHCQRIENSNYITLTTEAIWCEPLLLFGKPIEGRVIWTKMYVNNSGCLMTLMIQKANDTAPGGPYSRLSEEDYILTLDKGYGREIGLKKLWQNIRSFGILIGKMYGGVDVDHIDNYEAPEWSGDLKTASKDLNNRSFLTEYAGEKQPFTYLKGRKISTPFAGDGVGELFPQVDGHKTLLVPDGDREISIIGPGYFGANDEVPYRQTGDDYRLQFPDGTVVYNKNDNIFYIIGSNQIDLKIGGLNASQDPGEASSTPSVTIKSGEINVQVDTSTYVKLTNSGVEIRGSQIDGLRPTLKVTNGSVEITGKLKVNGQTESLAFKTIAIPNVDAAVLKKIPPGP